MLVPEIPVRSLGPGSFVAVRDPREYAYLAIEGQARHPVWCSGRFTVPASVTDERVQVNAHKYIKKYGDYLERQGWEVLNRLKVEPEKDWRILAMTEPDRRPYVIWAEVKRTPQAAVFTVSDAAVPEMLRRGARIKERFEKIWAMRPN